MVLKSRLGKIGLLLSLVFAASLEASFSIVESSFSIGYTTREDQLGWNHADPSGTPDILSELKWEGLSANQATAAATFSTCNRLYFRSYATYGRIFRGKNSDRDYSENGREGLLASSVAKAGKGELFDLSAALGYRFAIFCERLAAVPLFGLSWHEQHLRMYDGKELFPEIDEIGKLHSSYKTRWWGPWVGGDLIAQPTRLFTLFASFEYHWGQYQGKGHWNLREDFLTGFKHRARESGILLTAGGSYRFYSDYLVTLLCSYQEWCFYDGTHSRPAFGEKLELLTVKMRLNEGYWRSFQAALLFGRSF